MSAIIETIKGGCPICGRDVKGNDKFLFFCPDCDLLFSREHLRLSTEELNRKIKEAVLEKYRHNKKDLPKPELEKLPLRPVAPRPHSLRRVARIPLKSLESPRHEIAEPAAIAPKPVLHHPLTVVNLFFSTDLRSEIDPARIATLLPEAQYDTKKFSGLLLRYADPKGTVIVFPSGRAMVTGVRTRESAHAVFSFAIKRLALAGTHIDRHDPLNLENITCTGNLMQELNLKRLALRLPNCEYEPEDFPGLVFRILDPKNTFILFENGKLVSAGAKRDEDLGASYHALLHALKAAGA